MYNPYSLCGKKILITGASSGIGRCTAIECSRIGATVIITGRDERRLHATFENLSGDGHSMVIANLVQEEDLKLLVASTPVLDGVFFCAGITDTTLIKFLTKEKIERVFDVNFTSPFLLTRMLIQEKKINKKSSLVYMSSMGAEQTTLGLGIYAASKAGMNAMMRSVANEMASKKVRANSIMPMMVKTELVDNITILTKEELEKDEAKYPLGYGRPEDIAYAAIYLLSDASSWITGSCIKMDGGSTLG